MAKKFSIILFFIFSVPFSVSAANLSVSPAGGTFEVGDRVTIRIIATGDVPFNAISGDVLFPTDIFLIESVSKTTSVLNFWVTEPTFLKSIGSVRFEGVALGGFQGTTGTAVTVNLRAKGVGTGKVSFRSGQILANDGEGTDITGDLIGATFSVKEATKPPIKEEIPTPPPVVEIEIPQPKPTLQAPEIMLGTRYGERSIVGTSNNPKSQVLLTFISFDGSKIFITGVADSDGGFSLVIPNSLKRGSYSVSAVMVKEDNTNSQTSNILTIKVGNIFSDLGYETWSVMIALIILIVYLLLRIYFHLKKDKFRRKSVKHESDEAEKIAHKSFDIIREDIGNFESEKLSVSERKIISGIKKDINEAEKTVDKEIKDIESI